MSNNLVAELEQMRDALNAQIESLSAGSSVTEAVASYGQMSFLSLLMIFVLACFIGFYVVWSVTPALHSPLMSVTNAISSVIIVGAMIALGVASGGFISKLTAFIGVMLASVNIFGGFAVTERMLAMFKKKKS